MQWFVVTLPALNVINNTLLVPFPWVSGWFCFCGYAGCCQCSSPTAEPSPGCYSQGAIFQTNFTPLQRVAGCSPCPQRT